MVRMNRLGQAVAGSVLPEYVGGELLPAIAHAYAQTATSDVFYIGLGDQFDDDRRRIRAVAPR